MAARNGGRLGMAALAAILALGLGLRVAEAWDGRGPVYDAAAYAAIAANLERGEGFTVGPAATQPSSNYSPGLPLLVAGLYEVTGGVNERLARLVLAAVGTLGAWLAYLLGRRLARAALAGRGPRPGPGAAATEAGGEPGRGTAAAPNPHPTVNPQPAVDPRPAAYPQPAADPPPSAVGNRRAAIAGLLAALAVAVYPALVEYQGMLMSEPLAATLLAGGVLAILWAWEAGPDRASLARWLLPGALLGALSLVRPEYLGVSALLALAIALLPARSSFSSPDEERLDRVGWRRGAARGVVLLAGVALVVLPWTVRNAVALERVVPISTGGGQVLFAGTYLPSDGDPERVGAGVVAENPDLFGPEALERLRLEQILARLAAREYPELEPDQALSRMGRRQLWHDLSGEPVAYAGFVASKVWRVWGHGPRAVMHEPGWEVFHWAIVALGLLGLAALVALRRPEALIAATVLLAITAIGALLVASPRRFLVLLPLVAALAGVGAAWAWARVASYRGGAA